MVLLSDAGRPETTLAIACLAANVALIYRIKLQERAASVRGRARGGKLLKQKQHNVFKSHFFDLHVFREDV